MMRLSRVPQLLLVFVLLGILCLVAPAAVAHADNPSPPTQCSGYHYTVRLGDTWSVISRRVGTPITTLKAANPQAVRPRDLIYAGETLCIPSPGGGADQGGYWYQVKPGDTWNKVARATGVSVQQLWEANPGLVNRMQWLYLGQRVWIPTLPTGTGSATASPKEPTATALPPPTPTATVAAAAPVATSTEPPPTPVPTSTSSQTVPAPTSVDIWTSTPTGPPPTATPVSPGGTDTPAATAPVAPAATPIPTSLPTSPSVPVPADCPQNLPGYVDAVTTYLNRAGNTPATLETWLAACHVLTPGVQRVVVAPITAPTAADVLVVVHDPAAVAANPKGQLLVYHQGSRGYTLAHKREGQGRITLVEAADVNADLRFDLVYSDSSCGRQTCFGTLYVDSWDGRAYLDWITSSPTIAEPEYTVREVLTAGQGREILVHGGVIGSIGAGPQRPWTETYISPNGGAYVLFSQVYDPSACFYHKILDANRAFDSWALDGFDPAIEAYRAAVAEQGAEACGSIRDEVATLRDFARFRLLVADVAAGRATEALPLASQISNPALRGAATTFLNSYRTTSSVIQACRDTTKYAEANPASWQFLADWGYANPSFTSGDLCPLS